MTTYQRKKCPHGRRRAQCIECGGGSVCEHKRLRNQCIECGGAGICEHKRQRNKCVECGGSNICEHKRQRHQCLECGGASICEHKRQRHHCKLCTDPMKVSIKNMIKSAKTNDIKYNRYDAEKHIDNPFVTSLLTEYTHCYYPDCRVPLQHVEYQPDLATIERLDNSIGHIKSNCVICCRTCNYTKKSNKHT